MYNGKKQTPRSRTLQSNKWLLNYSIFPVFRSENHKYVWYPAVNLWTECSLALSLLTFYFLFFCIECSSKLKDSVSDVDFGPSPVWLQINDHFDRFSHGCPWGMKTSVPRFINVWLHLSSLVWCTSAACFWQLQSLLEISGRSVVFAYGDQSWCIKLKWTILAFPELHTDACIAKKWFVIQSCLKLYCCPCIYMQIEERW